MATSSSWVGKTAFVTGGTGFVGSQLVCELVNVGANVVVLLRDLPRVQRYPLGQQVQLVNGSVEDYNSLRNSIAEYQPDNVFHLASQSLAEVAKEGPRGTLEVNVRGTWNILEACRTLSVGQVVVASSDKAYSTTSDEPCRESTPVGGVFPYDVSKSCADLVCKMYATTYRLPVAVARFANIFGGGDLNFSRLIPGVVRTTLEGGRFVIRGDGKSCHDFLYVQDAIDGLLKLADGLNHEPSLAGEAFNFSLGISTSVMGVVEQVVALAGAPHLRPVVKNEAISETRRPALNSDKARQVLDWLPQYSLQQGLIQTIAWYRHHLGLEAQAAVQAAG
jgi:CDP-glucose 4,6-dehydratase